MDPMGVLPFVKRPLEHIGGRIVVAGHLMSRGDPDKIIEVHGVNRAETQRLLEVGLRLFRPVRIGVQPAQPAVGPSGIGIERHGPFQHNPGRAIIPREGVDRAQYGEDQRIFRGEICRMFGKR